MNVYFYICFCFLKSYCLFFEYRKKLYKEYEYLNVLFVCVCFSGEEIWKKVSILFGIQFDKKRYEDLVNLLDIIKKYKDLVRDF